MSPSILLRTLTALLSWLLLVPAFTYASDDQPLTSVLLMAGPDISDPFFGDSVVLVMNNLGPAPIGIIINRPTAVPVSQLFPAMKRLVTLPDKVYFGGPIESDSVWFLFRTTSIPPREAIKVLDGICLSADRALLLKLLRRDQPLEGLRIFIGHAGWGPGQLEEEIASGAWTLEHASPDALFNGQSEHPWPSEPATPELPKHST
ncbi:MAG: YqgE/AlgH family protein [Steroidobacteraceae bacterium]